MRIPQSPPDFQKLWQSVFAENSQEKMNKILMIPRDIFVNKKYIHWDKLKYLPPPEGMNHEEWWLALKLKRKSNYISLPLVDISQKPFQYLLAGPLFDILHQIDLGGGGSIQMPEPITNPDTKDRYYVSSLIEEAITSSQLEGAATTRKIAGAMLRSGRRPRNKSERMIMNNYLTMKRINEIKERPLSKELIFEIFNLITEGTWDDSSEANRFRKDDDNIIVGNEYGDVFYKPPLASEIDERLAILCDFANGKIPDGFVHPVIRSIVIHFWLSYIHPFVDGNGRTARALFYWSMLRHGYWLGEYISISSIIHKAPVRYGTAFLHTETDDNDLTYFIYYHLKVIQRAVHELHAYIKRKTLEIQNAERELQGITRFNRRQQALISHALRHPSYRYTIQSHQTSHKIVHQTARSDLQELTQRKILIAEKIGKRWYFTPAADMAKKLAVLE